MPNPMNNDVLDEFTVFFVQWMTSKSHESRLVGKSTQMLSTFLHNALIKALRRSCKSYGIFDLAILSLSKDSDSDGITLLVKVKQSSKPTFPFTHYDCSKYSASYKSLLAETESWQKATRLDLTAYSKLPVIDSLERVSKEQNLSTTYGVSLGSEDSNTLLLVIASLDSEQSTRWSQTQIQRFAVEAKNLGFASSIYLTLAMLEAENRVHDNFTDNVVHDIRNPIQNIVAMAEYLQLKDISLNIKQKKAIEIAEEVKRINELSQRLWILGTLDKGILDPNEKQRISLYKVIEQCQDEISFRASRSNKIIMLDHSLQDLPLVLVNKDLFYNAVLSLLDNAVKYSFPNTEVRITGSFNEKECKLTFSNVGIGVVENDKDLIFEKYYRGRNVMQHSSQGTGIGLAIVKEFADRYGKVKVENKPIGKSDKYLTEFHLTIRRN